MKRIYTILALSFLISQCQGGSASQSGLDVLKDPKINSGTVLAKVGGVELKEGFLTSLSAAMPNMKDKLDNPMAKKKLVESILEQELMYQEGVKRGMLNNPEVTMKILINQRSVIAAALMQAELDKAMATEYEKRKDSDFTKIALSQIVVPFKVVDAKADPKKPKAPATDADKKAALKMAQDLVKKIKAGESFEDVAKKHSSDKRTAERGGQAGHVAKLDKRYEKQGLKGVVEKAFSLKLNQVSDPIETENGYYIVKATSAPEITPLEEAKRVLSFDLQAQIKTEILAQLKKDHPIEFVNMADAPSNVASTTTENKPMEMKMSAPTTDTTATPTEKK